MPNQIDPNDLAALIQASIAKNTGGAAPGDAPVNNPILPPRDPNQLNIVPGKPDPEAAANAQIAAAANRPAAMDPRKVINPATGLPMSIQQPPMTPEEQQRQDMNAFKLQYLRNKAAGK